MSMPRSFYRDGREPKPATLVLLERLNAARRAGDQALAAELDTELDEADRRRGWTRSGGPGVRHLYPAARHSWRERSLRYR